MESQSSSPLPSYFRHGTVTVPPDFFTASPSVTSTSSPLIDVSFTTLPSVHPSASSISSSSSPRATSVNASRIAAFSSIDNPAPSSTSTSVGPLNNGFGNPSATSSLDRTNDKPYNPSSLVVVFSILGVLAASVTIWLIFRYFSRRRQMRDEDGVDRSPRPNQEGWAKRMTFTGNREKFWQRLDDYHESLKAREEGRVKRSMAGVSVGQVPRFSTMPAGLDIHPSFQAALPNVKPPQKDNASVKTFMIGSEDELAYLQTARDGYNHSTPIHQRAPPSVPVSAASSRVNDYDKATKTLAATDMQKDTHSDNPHASEKRVQSLARATPLPTSDSEDSIDRLGSTDRSTGAVKSILVSHDPHPTQQVTAPLQPAQQHLSTFSNYSTPPTPYLTPDFIPLSQMAHQKNQPDYRSPTESIYGCYKTDEERHASFISTTSTSAGTAAGPKILPAVPPIPSPYRK